MAGVEPLKRRSARYRVHLSVRYEAAADFVREYAENLSRGGLFIRGGRSLTRHGAVVVEIELPGVGSYQVRAEVMHVISDELAAEQGRVAGAGLAIREAPDGFEEALADYLVRLGRRAVAKVLVSDKAVSHLLVAAGYQAGPVPAPAELGALLSRPEPPLVVGVVVTPELATAYQRTAEGAEEDLVVVMDGPEQIDEVLVRLDRRL